VTAVAPTGTGNSPGKGQENGTEDLLALAERLVGQARAGEALEVTVGRSTSTSVRAYKGDVEQFTSATTFGVGVRVLVDGRQGFAHAGSFDPEVLAATLADARDNAEFSEPDEWAGLAEPDGVPAVEADLWNQALADLGADDKVALALDLERRVLAADPRVTGVRVCAYGDSAGEFALASTTGIRAASRSTSCWISTNALATDGEETQIGGSSDVGRAFEALDLDKVAREAAERATRLLGAKPVPTQRLPLLLEPRLAATLLGIVGGTLTGDVVIKGRSPFGERAGEQVASPLLTLLDDPTDARSLGADAYDGEGLACRRNVLIDAGILVGFLHNSYTGRRAGAASTGSAVRSSRNLPGVGLQAMAMQPGDRSWEQLVAGLETGFVLQSMHGLHSGVNPTSGDFSVGADGLMVRGGALAEPVREVTIASTLQRLLLDIVAVGAELEWLPSGSGCAALLIGEVALSGR
jgi:PmbA protein